MTNPTGGSGAYEVFARYVALGGEVDGYPCWCRSYKPVYSEHDWSCPVFMRGDELRASAPQEAS